MSHSKLFQFVLLFSSLVTFHDLVHADLPILICDNKTTISNSFFEDNLANLLIFLESNASTSRFYNISIGNHSDTLHGAFLCYQYDNFSNDDCKKCVTSASENVRKRCPNGNEDVVVWEENCQLRYSTQRFVGELNLTGNVPLDNVLNISVPDQFRDFMNETLHNLSKVAAFNSSGMYANGIVAFLATSSPVYAFLQCTPDLSPNSCNTCLERAITDILDKYYYSIGARLLSRSCYLRYEHYHFFDVAADSPGSMPIPEGKPRKLKNQLMIAILVTGAAMLVFGLLIYCYIRKKKVLMGESHFDLHKIQSTELGEIDFQGENLQGHSLHPQDLPFYEINILNSATGNFSEVNKLGEGGFGPVYKGILPEGNEVAVKRLSGISEQGSDEFLTEAALIQRLQHKNLVRLLGFSTYGEEKLLIYEYMPNSSLDFFLIDPRKRAQLDWSRRLNIINGVARGMLYLHQDSRLKIIHRDLKPSNVLLDKDMNPKISDFGNARIFASNDGEANTSKIAGTYGYMAPEFAMEGLYSTKSDMFSFGVLVLEIITGRQNFVGPHLSKRTPNLIANAWQLWNEGIGEELMDPLLGDSCPLDEFLRCMHIGLMCVQEDPCDRPTMPTVVIMLNCETETPSQPTRPAFTDGRFIGQHQTCYNNLSVNHLTISDILPR